MSFVDQIRASRLLAEVALRAPTAEIADGQTAASLHAAFRAGIEDDVGCVVDGYSSDTSRNDVFGAPTPDQARLHGIIERAFEAGFAALRPGVRLGDVHRITTAALERAGLTGFSRGHFGHGLGHGFFSEQWPFIAADRDVEVEPGMVLAFEVPIYVTGLGGFNLQDQLIVTEAGVRSMNTLPRHLVSLGG